MTMTLKEACEKLEAAVGNGVHYSIDFEFTRYGNGNKHMRWGMWRGDLSKLFTAPFLSGAVEAAISHDRSEITDEDEQILKGTI